MWIKLEKLVNFCSLPEYAAFITGSSMNGAGTKDADTDVTLINVRTVCYGCNSLKRSLLPVCVPAWQHILSDKFDLQIRDWHLL